VADASLDRRDQAARKALVMAELERYPYREPWWLRGGHLQTAWGPLFRNLPGLPLRRERLDTPDDDFLDLYIRDGDPDKPTVLLLHGLEGCIESNYVIAIFRRFLVLGWNTVMMEYRGCGPEMNRARRLYHNAETGDLAFTVNQLVERGVRRLYILGVSLGGNVSALWLGKHAGDVPDEVRAAAVISAPYEPLVSGPNLDRMLGGVYARRFVRTLKQKALAKERQYPGCIDADAVRRARTLEEFDDVATARLHGFKDVWDYWEQSGSGQHLHKIRRPTLLLSAANDPFTPSSTLPRAAAEASPYLHPLFPDKGGHVGFIYGPSPFQTRHWAEEQTVRFFQLYEELGE
jgi:uncharacterized protein